MFSLAVLSWLFSTVPGLSFLALIISFILLHQSIKGGSIPGCGTHSACHTVSTSRWARVGHIPVAAFGVSLYSVLLILSLVCHQSSGTASISCQTLVIGSVIAGAAAVWFISLQLLVIRRICPLCLLVQIIGMTLCVVVFTQASARPPTSSAALTSQTNQIIIGIACVLLLALVQILFPSKTYMVVPATQMPRTDKQTVSASTLKQDEHSSTVKPDSHISAQLPTHVEFMAGRVKIAISDWPMLGSRHATRIIAILFDTTCQDCRRLYRLSQQAVTQHPDAIAVITIPVPLHPACNPAVKKAEPDAAYACEFAQLFLAVWRADSTAFPTFARWLMEPTREVPLHEAKSKAHKLVNSSRLSLALMDPTIEKQISEAVQIHQQTPSDKLPQLLLPKGLPVGHVPSLKEFLQAIEEN